MEPVWLGLGAPSILSAATAVGRTALAPFSAVLKLATNSREPSPELTSATATLTAARNPHTALLSEILTGQPIGDDGTLEIADIRTHADDLQDDLQRRIHDLLQRAGITLEEPVQLRISPIDGQLEIAGDSPDRAVLEAALASDPSLAADFRQLAAMRSLVAVADKSRQFAEAYARDPYQAVNDYGELFDSSQLALLLATPAGTQLRFETE